MKTPAIPAIDDVLMRREMGGPRPPRQARKSLGPKLSSPALLVLIVLGTLLAGCATEDKSKPWEKDKKKWYQSDMDAGDRAFYHSFFLGN